MEPWSFFALFSADPTSVSKMRNYYPYYKYAFFLLRWLKTVSSTLQDLDVDVSLQPRFVN